MKIEDIISVKVFETEDDDNNVEFDLVGSFVDGQKFSIAIFDVDCEDICNDVRDFLESKIKLNRQQ